MNQENCLPEDVLSLYVEGDVPQMAAVIQRHLHECAACSLRVAAFQESQSIFKSLGQETVSSAALASVRTRVVDEVRHRGGGFRLFLWLGRLAPAGLPWRYALGSLAIVLAVSAVVWRSRVPEQRPERLAPVAATAPVEITRPAVAVAKAPATLHHPKHVKRVPAPKPKPATAHVEEEPHQIVMKIITDDPNIIIYWLLDPKGDGE
jgi:anti-sigma factor RsiW